MLPYPVLNPAVGKIHLEHTSHITFLFRTPQQLPISLKKQVPGLAKGELSPSPHPLLFTTSPSQLPPRPPPPPPLLLSKFQLLVCLLFLNHPLVLLQVLFLPANSSHTPVPFTAAPSPKSLPKCHLPLQGLPWPCHLTLLTCSCPQTPCFFLKCVFASGHCLTSNVLLLFTVSVSQHAMNAIRGELVSCSPQCLEQCLALYKQPVQELTEEILAHD